MTILFIDDQAERILPSRLRDDDGIEDVGACGKQNVKRRRAPLVVMDEPHLDKSPNKVKDP